MSEKMAKVKKHKVLVEEEVDAMDLVNDLELEVFVDRFVMAGHSWKFWTHPRTSKLYTLTIQTSTLLSKADLESCFALIQHTSSADYRKSKDGWKPRAKKQEMKLLDLKYILVKNEHGKVEGFCSLMPTFEDGYPVIYCYEIHLGDELLGTGLGALIMSYLEFIGSKIPEVSKIMLTVFLSNERAVNFYKKLGYVKDEFSPEPKILRNGTKVEAEYVILSKAVHRED